MGCRAWWAILGLRERKDDAHRAGATGNRTSDRSSGRGRSRAGGGGRGPRLGRSRPGLRGRRPARRRSRGWIGWAGSTSVLDDERFATNPVILAMGPSTARTRLMVRLSGRPRRDGDPPQRGRLRIGAPRGWIVRRSRRDRQRAGGRRRARDRQLRRDRGARVRGGRRRARLPARGDGGAGASGRARDARDRCGGAPGRVGRGRVGGRRVVARQPGRAFGRDGGGRARAGAGAGA